MVEVIINTLKWVIIFFLLLVAIIFIGKLISEKKEVKKEVNKGVQTVEQGIRKIEQNTTNDVTVDQNSDDIEKKQETVTSPSTVDSPDTGVEDHIWIFGLMMILGGFIYVIRYQKLEKE